MKKTVSLITAVLLLLSLCVGGVNAESASDSSQSKEQTAAQLGQEINLGSAAVTFSAAKLTYTIGESFIFTAQDDMRFFGLVCFQKRNVFVNGRSAQITDPCQFRDIELPVLIGWVVPEEDCGNIVLGCLRSFW